MQNTTSYKSCKDLKCWKQGRELKVAVSEIAKKFPGNEKFELTSQIVASSRYVTNNITEGYGRYTYSDTSPFFIQACGSVTETIDHLIIAFDEKYISEKERKTLEQTCDIVFKLIIAYLNYLERQKGIKPNYQSQIPNSI